MARKTTPKASNNLSTDTNKPLTYIEVSARDMVLLRSNGDQVVWPPVTKESKDKPKRG